MDPTSSSSYVPNMFGCRTYMTDRKAKLTSFVTGVLASLGISYCLLAMSALPPLACGVIGLGAGAALGFALCCLIKPDAQRYARERLKELPDAKVIFNGN